jgi:hypothetical protein
MTRVLRINPERLPVGLARARIGDSSFDPDRLIGGVATDLYKPDGKGGWSLVLRYLPKALPSRVCDQAALIKALIKAATWTDNRGDAAGGRHHRLKKDGTVDPRSRAEKVQSGIMGYYYDKGRRRTTAFTKNHRREWLSVLPLVLAVNDVFRRNLRDCSRRYNAMIRARERTDLRWVIPGTVFTTVTVNKDYPTTVHKDKGDLPAGFGVMAVVRAGEREWEGGYLVFPRYRVAVDMRHGDVLLADVHGEWHGNTPIFGAGRLSLVCYFRTKMQG